ncbi:MAG: DNA polymerase III subunit gamma/tau [Oscillospiraceae bacterium]
MYLALYRKYRPRTFDDVISQEHITTTLKNQITNGTAAHAYLFTGSRGTGKTTCAKILAMAVNCLNPQNGNPCLECANCRDIAEGTATDIVEMDAASNNGVDDVRQLRDEVAYTPVSCKYRVYIIDEVHMLSPAAFNALLKTLEEPPEHVKFILATTELHKVLPTIISRCQRFDFRRIDIKDSAARLLSVAEKEGVTLDADAAELISRLSDGGMRDALSVLDRCVSADSHITSDTVRSCAGVADNRHLFIFSEMVSKNDVSGCIRLLSELHTASKDIARLVDELSEHYRDLMLYKTVPADTDLLSAMPYEYGDIQRICEAYTLEDILRCLTLLQQCADNIGKTKQRRTAAEMCLVRMCLGLGAQTEGAPKPKLHMVAPAASSGIPAGATIQIIPVEPQKEEFVQTPIENLSRESAANLSKLRELNQQTAKIVNSMAKKPAAQPNAAAPQKPEAENSAPANTAPVQAAEKPAPAKEASFEGYAPPPDMNSAPAAPMDFFLPPEEPPMEFVPQREFETAYAPMEDMPAAPAVQPKPAVTEMPAQPSEPKLKSAPVRGETSVEKEPAVKAEETPKRAALKSITAQQWQETLEKLYPMTKMMLKGSRVALKDGFLEIYSSNKVLLSGVKEEELKNCSAEISEALDADVRIRIVEETKESAAQAQASAVRTLLSKAEGLNIEVIYK